MLGVAVLLSAFLWLGANAHLAVWHKGMYCLNVCFLFRVSLADSVAYKRSGQYWSCRP